MILFLLCQCRWLCLSAVICSAEVISSGVYDMTACSNVVDKVLVGVWEVIPELFGKRSLWKCKGMGLKINI